MDKDCISVCTIYEVLNCEYFYCVVAIVIGAASIVTVVVIWV
jgi:hypothetical protein